MESQKSLSNLQLELLKVFSFDLPEEELIEIKQILARHFADKLSQRIDTIWETEGLDQDAMDQHLNQRRSAPRSASIRSTTGGWE
jgi:hypothetical protein